MAPMARSQIDRAATEQGGSSMSIIKAAALAGAAGGLCVGLALGAAAQEFNDKPLQENWWPTEWGRRRQGRRAEPDDARNGARGGRAGEAGQDRDARQALRVRYSLLRRARLPAATSRAPRPAGRSAATARVPRRAGHRRDRPGRHPVRRPGPYRRPHLAGRSLLQRPRARGDLRARPGQHGPGHGRSRGRVRRRERASSVAACCSMRPSTAA